MQCGIFNFACRTGTGNQTVTGIVDKNSANFTPTLVIFIGAYTAPNFLDSADSGNNAYDINMGIDLINSAGARSVADVPFVGVKIASGAEGTQYSLVELQADNSFGGNIERVAKITSAASGQIIINYATNARTGDTILGIALGGSNLGIDLINGLISAHTYSGLSGNPIGMLLPEVPGYSSSGTIVTGAGGGGGIGFGFAAKFNNEQSALHFTAPETAGNARYQKTGKCAVFINSNAIDPGGDLAISSWGANSFSTTAGTTLANSPIVFSGEDLDARSGNFTQPLTAGSHQINTGIDVKFFMLMSYGAPASTSVRTDEAQISMGWANGTSQCGIWTGEASSELPLTGARYLSTNTIGRAGTPNGSSTVFTTIVSVTSITNGIVTLNFSTVDGNANQWLWYAMGESSVPVTDASPGSGLYKLVPNKIQDTLYETFDPVTTIIVKIPDPSASGYLAGDE